MSVGSLVRSLKAAAGRVLRPAPPESLSTRELGRLGESAAAKLLRTKSFKVIARNVQVPMGEADLVCRDPGGCFVIVEVKTRLRREGAPERSNTIAPEAAITVHKRRKLRQITRWLVKSNRWEQVRIDVVCVEYFAGKPEPVLRHYTSVC
jgi:Holliday junction resolvase-like predicted endonuclease